MEETPPLPGEEALYATITQVLDAAKKDEVLQEALRKTAAVGTELVFE